MVFLPRRPKQALLPKGKKAAPSIKEAVVNAEGGPILAADPRVAALERAARRKELAELADEGGGLEDMAGAEEDIEVELPEPSRSLLYHSHPPPCIGTFRT